RYLLKLGVVIDSYNDHRSAPFSRACWLDKHHQLYSELGADIVMESISLIDGLAGIKSKQLACPHIAHRRVSRITASAVAALPYPRFTSSRPVIYTFSSPNCSC